ncbi:hypothetical protein Tsubulata_012427 [Turnera subulata]|uniref:YTH domain-containing protein n=1 Tax=Turnera subulata TaxID=218843 RepID=A0A9Q0JSZ8_9ROSI|nr:hypothetical protein Tsubulata_012427 [Turnera subulata]
MAIQEVARNTTQAPKRALKLHSLSKIEDAADLLQNLSLDTQNKNLEIPEPTKKTAVYQYGAVESGIASNGQVQTSERSVTPFLPDAMDPTLCYLPGAYPSTAYYYGFNGTNNEWDDYSRFINPEGVEMTPGVYGDNGSIMYHNGYGYPSYGPYSPATSPAPTLGTDGQLYGPQHYQYPPFFQPVTPTNGSFTPSPNQSATSQGELPNSAATDQKPLPVDTTKGTSSNIANGGGMKGNNSSTPYKPLYQNSSVNLNNTYGRGTYQGGYQDARFGFDGQYKNNSSFSKSSNFQSSKNHGYRQNSNYMGLHHPGTVPGMGSTHGYINRMYPNKFYHYGNTYRSGMGFGAGGFDSRINPQGWLATDNKYKPRGRGNGYFGYRNDGVDGLNELNRGPRAKGFKNQKGLAPITSPVKEQNVPAVETANEEKDETSIVPDREQYNKADFPEDYTDAKFFVIKSYSEDDVHKSIKYNVWASTPNGNKKLDAAYLEAQQKPGGCPVFLFFSVNTSGQFVGLAEMVGPVDFQKNVEYWQQDKWTGCFPLKWHIVKDIPNSSLKHITLENNENKPVTNSRDTQEVTEVKPVDEKKDVINGVNKSGDPVSDVVKEPGSTPQSNGDVKHLENGSVGNTEDSSNLSKPVASEKKVLANGTANESAELLQNLSLDSKPKPLEIPETSVYQYGTVESGGQVPSSDRSMTPFIPDLSDPNAVCYIPNGYTSPAYYYGGYNGTGSDWDGYSRFANGEGVDMTPGVYGENGSVMYHNGYGYTYSPYSPATSPVPTLGNDSQLYGPQHYQYSPYFQPLTPTSAAFSPNPAAFQGELSAAPPMEQKPLPAETARGNSSGDANGLGANGSNVQTPCKPSHQYSSFNLWGGPSYQDPGLDFDGQYKNAGTTSFPKANNVASSRNYNFSQNSNLPAFHHPGPMSDIASTPGFMNRTQPNKLYNQYGNNVRPSFGYGGYNSRANARGWLGADSKYTTKSRSNNYIGYGNHNVDGLNELNRGPRAKGFKDLQVLGPVTLPIKGQNVPSGETTADGKDEVPVISDHEQYNRTDFPVEYADAKFFIIKSYSEDDVHKSIKYNVWASTPNGNKKLDSAYQEAQQKPGSCPVFLFFSVNASGQFVGVAEMVGPVDFDKNLEYWQQDKWTGCFPLKWHIVKDVANSLLKHITLENNENKPVTNSRDTQEVKLEKGLKMLKIFKDHSSKTCILDDFDFYEKRQKIVQEKKAKQQQFQKQVLERKLSDEKKEVVNGLQNSIAVGSNAAVKHSGDVLVGKTGDQLVASNPVVQEKRIAANGIVNVNGH